MPRTMRRHVYLNGRIVEEKRAGVSVFDRGLNYGDGLFETVCAVDGRPVLIKEHMARLGEGLKTLGIPRSRVKTLFSDVRAGAVERLLKRCGLSCGTSAVRITVTRGVDTGAHAPSKGLKPTRIITARPVDEKRLRANRLRGVGAVTIKGVARALPGVKTLNYLPSVIARIEAGRRGATEGIFTTERGHIVEGAASNVFLVVKGALVTPLAGNVPDGALPGVTRARVMEIAGSLGLKARETRVTLEDLRASTEAFLTGSISGVTPLVRVDSVTIGAGRPGPVTRLIQREFGRLYP